MDKLFGRQPKFTRADFIPIARFTEGPMVIVVNDQTPYKTLKELVDDAKKRPNEIVFSSSGLYGALHLPAALFLKAAGLQMRHLPTNGGGPALTALLGNNSQVLVSSIAAANAQIKAGKLRALACFSDQARGVAAGRADPEGARLRRRILALGRPVRAQGHAGRRSSTSCAPNRRRRPTPSSSRRRSTTSATLSPISTSPNSPSSGTRTPSASRPPSTPSARCEDGRTARTTERSGQRMILRRDHVAGGVFVAGGAILFAMSGDLPFGTLASPGAGMMPKLRAGPGDRLRRDADAAGGRKPAACRRGLDRFHPRRDDRRRGNRRDRLYTVIGFILEHVRCCCSCCIYIVERRSIWRALAVSIGVTFGCLLCSSTRC